MKAKKCFVAAIVLSAVLLAVASSFWRGLSAPSRRALTGLSGKFGPMIEIVLPAAKGDGDIDIVDLETGRTLLQPSLENLNSSADGMMGWVHSNGLDISGFAWSGGAACVTYNMTIVAVDGKSWETITEEELLGHPALARGQRSPRRLILSGVNRPDTYAFRTGEGTLGMLRLVGLTQEGRGVHIRYKLINPPAPISGGCPIVAENHSSRNASGIESASAIEATAQNLPCWIAPSNGNHANGMLIEMR